MATSTCLHRTHRYYAPSPLKQLAGAAAEVKLDLIGYVTAKMQGLEGGLSSLFLHIRDLQLGGKSHIFTHFLVFWAPFWCTPT